MVVSSLPGGDTNQPNPVGRDVTAGDLITSGDSLFNRAREQVARSAERVQPLLKWRNPTYADDDNARRARSFWMTTFEP